jgi:hypothetical protein
MAPLTSDDVEMRTFVAKLAAAYWRTGVEKSSTRFHAWEAIDDLCRLPGIGSRLVVVLARYANNEDESAYLGAGPLENLVQKGNPEDLAVIEEALPRSPELRRALRSVNPPLDNEEVQAWLRDHR